MRSLGCKFNSSNTCIVTISNWPVFGSSFKAGGDNVVNYRTVSWPKASVIFLKLIFALGVLSIPGNLNTLGKQLYTDLTVIYAAISGAVGGSIGEPPR